MNSWQTWSLHTWNDKLLQSFFRRNADQQLPVVTLLVTAEALARVTGDPSADPELVRDAFVNSVNTGISRLGSLLEHATDYPGWPEPPPRGAVPRFVAHLLFTCVAASESSEELASETSFVARLGELAQGQAPANSLQHLPRLWSHLATWLASNSESYRELQLPDPGGFTRIGYTIRLAFPDRRDLRLLSDVLDRAGLSGTEPPIGKVVSLVASERFRQSFAAAFSEFRRKLASDPISQELLDHRFWAAVREASLQGRGSSQDSAYQAPVTLLAEEQQEELTVFAVSEEGQSSQYFSSVELQFKYGGWSYCLVPVGSYCISQDGLHAIASGLLSKSIRQPRISNQVDQGVLLFVPGSHGLLELATREQLSFVHAALVREELVSDFIRLVTPGARPRPTGYEGWVQLSDIKISPLDSACLEGTSLHRVWIIHKTVSPTTISLFGGVRADDGWLGILEVLPKVVSNGATEMWLQVDSDRIQLDRLDESTWLLPMRDISGTAIVWALRGETTAARREISFLASPSSEEFKPPGDSDAWLAEGNINSVSMSASAPCREVEVKADLSSIGERTAYLGRDVGEFVADPGNATWRVLGFGRRLVGTKGLAFDDSQRPEAQATESNLRSRWRTMLFKSDPASGDATFDTARRRVKGRACSSDLPKRDFDVLPPALGPARIHGQSGVTERLLRVIAGRAASKAGIASKEWYELAPKVLGLDSRRIGSITRAWMEAGILDVASSKKWRHQAIFPCRPNLICYRTGDLIAGHLSGLILPSTRSAVVLAASRLGVMVEDRNSISEFVPSTIALRFESSEHMLQFSRAQQIRARWLDIESIEAAAADYEQLTSEPPGHYSRIFHPTDAKGGGNSRLGESLAHYSRTDRPDYWVVNVRETRIWTYSRNVARCWAATLLGESILVPSREHMLQSSQAYLPLSLARILCVLGTGLPGPDSSGPYIYPVGSDALRKFVLSKLSGAFDVSKLR